MAEIKVTSRTATSFTMKVVNLDTSYTKDDRIYHIFISGGGYTDKDINEDGYSLDGGVTETPEHNIIGLTANTVYTIVVKFFSSSSGALLSKLTHDTKTLEDEGQPEPPTPTLRIAPWDWHSSNKSATAAQTEKSYQALINKGRIDEFSYKVWNDLCYKAKEIAAEMEETWNDFTFIDNILMRPEDTYMRAYKYNSLIRGLKKCGHITMGTVTKDETIITSDHFLTLAEDMNIIIDNINSW